MTAEIFRVKDSGEEVIPRTLLPGQTMRGIGTFSNSDIPIRVIVTAEEVGVGIRVQRIDNHNQPDTSLTDHYGHNEMYVLSKGIKKKKIVFHLHTH